MRRTMLAALLAGCMSTGAALAQAPERPAAPPAAGTAPQLDKSQALAAKLAGLVGFVNVSCPELRGEPERLHDAVRSLGIEPASLDSGTLHFAAASYLEAYRKDVPANCQRAIDTFGPKSSIVPNLVVRR